MIAAPKLLGSLDDHDVLWPFDDAYQGVVPTGVAADGAQLGGCDVEAPLTHADLIAHVGDGNGQPPGISLLHRQQVEGETLRRLCTDAGEPPQLVYQTLHGSLEHQPRSPPRPPVRPPISEPAASTAASIA